MEKTYEQIRAEWDAGYERATAKGGAGWKSFHERMAKAYRETGQAEQAEQAERLAKS